MAQDYPLARAGKDHIMLAYDVTATNGGKADGPMGAGARDAVAPRFDEHSVSVLDHLVDSEAASLDNLLYDAPADPAKDAGMTDALHALTGGPGGYDANADELYLQALLDLLA